MLLASIMKCGGFQATSHQQTVKGLFKCSSCI